MGGAAGGGGIGWIGGKGPQRRAVRQGFNAVESMMKDAGIPVPPRPMSQAAMFWLGFGCGLFLGLLAGLVFWELT